jgi:predicted amidophosphoribosyltransferase
MGTIDCLACGHDNSAGEEACSACSASLRLKLCANCEAINPHDARRCHNCSTERSHLFAWLIPGEAIRRRRGLRAAVLAVSVLAIAGFAAYQVSDGVPEAQAATVTAPRPLEPRTRVEPPKDSASSGGATGSSAQ